MRAWIALDVNPATDGSPLETGANTNTITGTNKIQIQVQIQVMACDAEVRAWIALDVNPATDGSPLQTEATEMKIMESNTNTNTGTNKSDDYPSIIRPKRVKKMAHSTQRVQHIEEYISTSEKCSFSVFGH